MWTGIPQGICEFGIEGLKVRLETMHGGELGIRFAFLAVVDYKWEGSQRLRYAARHGWQPVAGLVA